jgi:hypothetical protein
MRDGGLGEDAQSSIGPGDDNYVVWMLAVGGLEQLNKSGLIIQDAYLPLVDLPLHCTKRHFSARSTCFAGRPHQLVSEPS